MKRSLTIVVLSLVSAMFLVAMDLGPRPEQMVGAEATSSTTSNTELSPATTRVLAVEGAAGESVAKDGPVSTVSTLAVSGGERALVEPVSSRPSRVRVPAVGLDVEISPVGVDDQGLFDVPSADQVGWYQYGPSPGEMGSAVLAAHVDFNGEIGAFFELQNLEEGDLINVDYVDGSSQAFEVIEQVLYDKTSLPADELFRRSGDPVLQLATCGGTFDYEARSYQGNRVVTARPLVGLPVSAADVS